MSRARPAAVRYYFDADVRGLGQLLAQVRPDITYPGDPGGELHKRWRPPCVITAVDTPDEDWIPVVAEQQWLIITRDAHIQDHRRQIEAVRANGARMVALAGKDAIGNWAQLLLVDRVAADRSPRWPPGPVHLQRQPQRPASRRPGLTSPAANSSAWRLALRTRLRAGSSSSARRRSTGPGHSWAGQAATGSCSRTA